jgi:hypothetical protein
MPTSRAGVEEGEDEVEGGGRKIERAKEARKKKRKVAENAKTGGGVADKKPTAAEETHPTKTGRSTDSSRTRPEKITGVDSRAPTTGLQALGFFQALPLA